MAAASIQGIQAVLSWIDLVLVTGNQKGQSVGLCSKRKGGRVQRHPGGGGYAWEFVKKTVKYNQTQLRITPGHPLPPFLCGR